MMLSLLRRMRGIFPITTQCLQEFICNADSDKQIITVSLMAQVVPKPAAYDFSDSINGQTPFQYVYLISAHYRREDGRNVFYKKWHVPVATEPCKELYESAVAISKRVKSFLPEASIGIRNMIDNNNALPFGPT